MKLHRRHGEALGITDAELVGLTEDLKDAHQSTLPSLRSSLAAWDAAPEEPESSGLSRRSFLTRSGLLAAGGLALASSGAGAALVPRLTRDPSATGRHGHQSAATPTDVVVAGLAASLENLAVTTYAAALAAAAAGKLGKVPSAVATFASTAKAQHADHAAAWNALVRAAGYRAVTAPNGALQPSVNAAFAKVTDVTGVAELALTLEEDAAATYLAAAGVVTGTKAIATAASIQPVEMQHAAILHFILGQYPVPLAFAATAGAATTADAPKLVKA